MNKPYIICHMMMSIDGRISCNMTSKLNGVENYYTILNSLNTPSTLSGYNTSKDEMGSNGIFKPLNKTNILNIDTYSKKVVTNSYEIIIDRLGTLLWDNYVLDKNNKPLLIITSNSVNKEYLSYLDTLNISYISVGNNHNIDLVKAMDILFNIFNVSRLAVVGGGKINASFLSSNLIDELSILIGPGVDGRINQPSLFDGLDINNDIIKLKLKSIKSYNDGSIYVRYLFND